MTIKIITTEDNVINLLCGLETFCKENKIDYMHGRIGEPTEYFEFVESGESWKEHVRYAAQACGSIWFVYRIEPGKKGRVQTLASDNDMDKAVKFAARACSSGLRKEVTNDR